MNCGLGSHSIARTGIKQSLTTAYQVWCPHVAQAPRVVAKQAQATSLAAPSYAPGGLSVGRTLLPDDTDDSDSHSTPVAEHERPSSISLTELQADVAGPADASSDGATAFPLHVATWTSDHSDPGSIIATCAGEAGASPVSSGSYGGGRAVSVQRHQHLGPETSNGSNLPHTRPPADRTAEASSSSSSAGLVGSSSCISSRRRAGRNSAVCRTAASGGGGGRISNLHSSGNHFRQAVHPPRSSSQASDVTSGDGGGGGGTGSGDHPATAGGNAPEGAAAAAASNSMNAGRDASTGPSAACADAGGRRAAAGGRQPVAAPAAAAPPPPRQQPLTLERLWQQNDALRTLELAVVQQRLGALCGLLQLDETPTLMLVRVVPGLLLTDSAVLQRTWRRLCVSLGGEEPARAAAAAAPLLLVLPSERVPACVASLAAATALPRAAAAAFVAEWPQLATHAPASLAAKLEGLRQLLGPPGPAAAPAASAATLRAALRAAPRLLTFSTAALTRHYSELSALLGSTERLRTALAREPGLLLQRPSTVAAKLALLRQLMDCDQQPGAVAALVVRAPGLLRRSLAALSSGCRALSIWQFRRRDKLRMCISRPGLLTLPPVEVHGRCRWLRRLMLSNAYYHAALRRLPPSLVGVVVAVLPGAWARLQYLAESSQECRMCLMDVVECRQTDFCRRFPEFERWLQFKTKLMGAENPWRGTLRIRGFNTARDKPTHGAPNQMNLLQRQQHVAWRPHQQRQQQYPSSSHGPSVPVVLAEAGEVRSGGSTVSRPRRVLTQPTMASAGGPPSSLMAPLTPPAMPPLTDAASGPLTMIILPAAARTRLTSEGLDAASTVAAVPAAVSAAAAEIPR